MDTVGIVAEYNPFHNGHLYHLQQAKEITGCEYSVAVMSGNFVQRGEPALLDKFIRAENAVKCGVDLILEIPPACAVASAEYFAKGAVSILDATGIVDALCFGSESGDLERLNKTAETLLLPETRKAIRREMKNGVPVYQATDTVVKGSPVSPNDILAVEYIKALKTLQSSITPHAVLRMGAGYHEKESSGSIASAAAIRTLLREGKAVSHLIPYEELSSSPVLEKQLETAMLYALRVKTPQQLTQYADVTEGLENKLYEACRLHDTVEEIIQAVKSKRYTYTRIRRILYNIFLDIPKGMREREPEFIRVLAFNVKGQKLLNRMKKTAALPIITCYTKKDFYQYETARLDKKENDLYALAFAETKVYKGGLRAIRV